MISLNHDASEVQVECNRIYSNCRGAAFTRCRTCFRRQSYGDFRLIPNIRAKSSPTCCDGVGEMRQTALTPLNPVAHKLKTTQGPLSVRALHVSNKPTNKNNEIHKQYKI